MNPPVPTPSVSASFSEGERYRLGQRATWYSVLVNVALTVAQIAVGWIAHSQSLIAHGLHSFSDLLSDVLVLFANHESRHPADAAHPYGHARIETAATLVLGGSLLAVGGGILWDAAGRLQAIGDVPPIAGAALWVAVATVGAKEALYRYLIRVADRLRSQLLAANAMHTRADAASALVVVAGIAGSMVGWRFLDLVAAMLMGFMILKLGGELAWGALRELIDTGLDDRDVAAIRTVLADTPGVVGVHELRTRRMAHRALVDTHVQVDGRISVSEGHQIAESARGRVLRGFPQVLDVLVHIDPEDDMQSLSARTPLPPRDELMIALRPLLDGLPEPERVVFHFLDGRVEAEVMLPSILRAARDAEVAVAEQRIEEHLRGGSCFSAISLHFSNAPK